MYKAYCDTIYRGKTGRRIIEQERVKDLNISGTQNSKFFRKKYFNKENMAIKLKMLVTEN